MHNLVASFSLTAKNLLFFICIGHCPGGRNRDAFPNKRPAVYGPSCVGSGLKPDRLNNGGRCCSRYNERFPRCKQRAGRSVLISRSIVEMFLVVPVQLLQHHPNKDTKGETIRLLTQGDVGRPLFCVERGRRKGDKDPGSRLSPAHCRVRGGRGLCFRRGPGQVGPPGLWHQSHRLRIPARSCCGSRKIYSIL